MIDISYFNEELRMEQRYFPGQFEWSCILGEIGVHKADEQFLSIMELMPSGPVAVEEFKEPRNFSTFAGREFTCF